MDGWMDKKARRCGGVVKVVLLLLSLSIFGATSAIGYAECLRLL